MKKPDLSYLRIDVICPYCTKKNFKFIGELVSNKDFPCKFCSTIVKLTDDERALTLFNELIDFWDAAYIPE